MNSWFTWEEFNYEIIDFDSKYASINSISIMFFMFFAFIIVLLFVCVVILLLTRNRYRARLADQLNEVRQSHEPSRIVYIENGGKGIRPEPLSAPITDQTEYNIVAAAIQENDNGQLF